MTEIHPDTSAARGRIIKRGGTPTRSRVARSEPARALTSARPRQRHFKDCKNPITIFIVVPLLFIVSASITWTRPLAADKELLGFEDTAIHSRFHDIEKELAGRFTALTVGTEIARPKQISPAVVAKIAVAPRIEASNPRAKDSAEGSLSVQRAALEKQVYKILKKHGKPTQNGKELASAIVSEAIAQDYDPVFVAAVIKSESAFNALARSHKGAQGLMQIMPRTGAWLADQQAIPRRKLTDPGHNLKLGIAYLKQLESEYKGNRVLTLVAYNWGPGHVESASSGSRRVPGEVMQYAVKILNDYRRWSSELRSSVG